MGSSADNNTRIRQHVFYLFLSAVSNLNQASGGIVSSVATSSQQQQSVTMMDASKTVSSANLPAVLASLPLGQQYELLKSVSGELVAVQTTSNKAEVRVLLNLYLG